MTHQIVGRDPLDKTIVEDFARNYPDLSDEELAERIIKAGRGMGADFSDVMSAEVVAKWRPEVTQ